jgi:2-polyprenyl-3-methyl-5-hydroxy-6-metoxy-1,4-benzoquinol methylase
MPRQALPKQRRPQLRLAKYSCSGRVDCHRLLRAAEGVMARCRAWLVGRAMFSPGHPIQRTPVAPGCPAFAHCAIAKQQHRKPCSMIKDNSDTSWKKWGDRDPYYGVLADDEFKLTAITDAAKKKFFESGRHHIDRVLSLVNEHFGEIKHASALDFGCGAGRLVLPLSERFAKVTGVDVSPGMLRAAAENGAQRGIRNLEFCLSDDALTQVQGSFDFVHCFLVLQHIPRLRGEVIVSKLIGRLNHGGVIAFHVPVLRTDSKLKLALHLARKNFLPINVLVNLIKRREWDAPFMQMNMYDMNRLLRIMSDGGLTNVFIETVSLGGFVSAFAFGKKSSEMPLHKAESRHLWAADLQN